MKRFSWLFILLLVLGLAFGLTLSACATGGDDDDDDDDSAADDDTGDDDTDDDDTDDDTEQFDVVIDVFTGPQLIYYYQGQIQAEIMDSLAMTADHLILVGATLVTPGTYVINFDYNAPPQSVDPGILLVLDWNLLNPSQYAEAYFAYFANVNVQATGSTDGAQFTAETTSIKMIQANLHIQGQNVYVEVVPTGKKALVNYALYNCPITTSQMNPHLCQ